MRRSVTVLFVILAPGMRTTTAVHIDHAAYSGKENTKYCRLLLRLPQYKQ